MSILRLTLIASVLALGFGCGGKSTTTSRPTPTATTTAISSTVYVVPKQRAAGFYGQPGAEKFFTPGDTLISALEGALPMFLGSSSDPRARTITRKLAGYKRQYVGVVIKGQKMIFGNFFCNTALSVNKPQFVDDGGSCYFTVLFDVSSRTFPKLQINGDA